MSAQMEEAFAAGDPQGEVGFLQKANVANVPPSRKSKRDFKTRINHPAETQ